MLGAVAALTMRAEASLRIGINAVWPPSQRATCGAYNIISVCEGAAGEAVRAGRRALAV